MIFDTNKNLSYEKDKQYVVKLLESASSIDVKYTDVYGKRQSAKVSLLGGKFDFKYFVDKDPENNEYRRLTKEYYNLIKNTFNIFDVIEDVPHFKEMIEGVTLSHNILLNTSIKYNTAFTLTKDTIRKNS